MPMQHTTSSSDGDKLRRFKNMLPTSKHKYGMSRATDKCAWSARVECNTRLAYTGQKLTHAAMPKPIIRERRVTFDITVLLAKPNPFFILSRLPEILDKDQKISNANLSITIQIISRIVVCVTNCVTKMRREEKKIIYSHCTVAIKVCP